MSKNLITLMTTAAELRTCGASWQVVAKHVNRSPKTCGRWPSRYPRQWEQLYLHEQRKVYDEVGNEGLLIVRRLLRSDSEKSQLKAAEIVMRWGPHLALAKATPAADVELTREEQALVAANKDLDQRRQAYNRVHGLLADDEGAFYDELFDDINKYMSTRGANSSEQPSGTDCQSVPHESSAHDEPMRPRSQILNGTVIGLLLIGALAGFSAARSASFEIARPYQTVERIRDERQPEAQARKETSSLALRAAANPTNCSWSLTRAISKSASDGFPPARSVSKGLESPLAGAARSQQSSSDSSAHSSETATISLPLHARLAYTQSTRQAVPPQPHSARASRMIFRLCVPALLVAAASIQAAPAKLTALQVDPPAIVLNHADDGHRILVTGQFADGTTRDLTRSVQYEAVNPALIAVSARGFVQPKMAGATLIEIKTEGLSKTIAVKVNSIAQKPVSYVNDLIPVLSKVGCNQGACHGAASGKKGFKLTLRGYDPAADYHVLARGPDGHRINRLEPAKSLLLQKATGAVLHEGGRLFDLDSPYGKILHRWIAEGTPNDLPTAPALVDLEVFPKFRALPATNLGQQLLVLAKFSDGSIRDVTGDCRYSSSNELAFSIDESGYVHASAKGEAAVTARYGPKIAISTIVAMDHDPKFAWPNPPEANYVDKLVYEKLKRMQIAPSDLCTDTEFLRRIYYDLVGLPPTPEEIKKFLADARTDKRARIIDGLLDRPEHAEYWALKMTDLLKLRFEALGDKGTWGLYRHVRDSIAGNQPFDKFVYGMLTAEGSAHENPAANYFRVFNNPEEASEATVQIFFGVRLLCAKCHDHPFEKWVQKDYYGMTAFFSQMTSKPGRGGDTIVFRTENPPRSRHPSTGETLLPKFLDAKSIDLKGDQDAREDLAKWLTSKQNPFFAKATVNRFWSHLFAKGIIDPVDDIRTSNPPSNGPLLEALTKDFTDHQFDVRYILKVMLNSRVYQLSARTTPTNADDSINFSHRLPRRLSAEQLLDTLSQATGIKQDFRSRYGEATIAVPGTGIRAGQLPDKQLTAETLDLFGRPRGESSCACERHEEASMTQALHLINGKSVAERIQSPSSGIAKIVQKPKIFDEQIIEELYLLSLCRPPNAKEIETMKKHFAAAGPDKLKAAQDAMWVLFNTREFLFNH